LKLVSINRGKMVDINISGNMTVIDTYLSGPR
jgi:hypothetical protein